MVNETAACAYDAIAERYDEETSGDRWMRVILQQHYLRLFQPGDRILDVACGTGLDALFLARAGVRIVGIDVSPRMVAALRGQVEQGKLHGLVDVRVMDVADLNALREGGERFDGIISAFAGLSMVADLERFAYDAARLLPPGGRLMVHLLNRLSLWEWLTLVRHGRWAAARGLGRRTERDFIIGGQVVRHHLYYPREAYNRFFATHFTLCQAYSLGALRPPYTIRRVPTGMVRVLEAIEPRLRARRPFLNWGRLFVLEMARRPCLDFDATAEHDAC